MDLKVKIQYATAVGMLVVGAGLAIADFILLGGHIDDSVLWLFAQCLIYAGSVFGVSVYVTGRLRRFEQKLKLKE